MKRIFKLTVFFLILTFALFLTVSADDYEEKSDLQLLKDGIIRLHPETTADDLYETFRIIDESDNELLTSKFFFFMQEIANYYYYDITEDELFSQFKEKFTYIDINNMDETYTNLFSLLDKFSYYLPAENSDTLWHHTNQKGIGLTNAWHDADGTHRVAGIYVDNVVKNSTGDRVGIREGDRIISINGIDIDGLCFGTARLILQKIAYDDDKFIRLVVERYDSDKVRFYPFAVNRKATDFDEYSITLYPETKTVKLTITNFLNDDTDELIYEDMEKLYRDGYRNVIIDLRNNSGGNVDCAVNISSLFIEGNVPLFTMGSKTVHDYYSFASTGKGHKYDKVFVLVNENTASSSEIMTMILRNTAGATVIGKKTYGKGVGQYAAQIIDGSTFAITAVIAYDLKGKSYNTIGLYPDIEMDNDTRPYEYPFELGSFEAENAVKITKDSDKAQILELEKRLAVMEFLPNDKVDGIWDDATSRSIIIIKYAIDEDLNDALTKRTVENIITDVASYKKTTVVSDTLIDYVLERIKK